MILFEKLQIKGVIFVISKEEVIRLELADERYVSEDVIVLAEAIAEEFINSPHYGVARFQVGCPDQWWSENIISYKETEKLSAKRQGAVGAIATYLIELNVKKNSAFYPLENSQKTKQVKKAIFVDLFEKEVASIRKSTVRFQDKLQTISVLAIKSHFEDKEEIKLWCNEREGNWHPVEQFWWVPLKKDFIGELRYLSFFKGLFYAPDEKVKTLITSHFDEYQSVVQEKIVFNEFSVFPFEEREYMTGYTTGLNYEELPQTQGWINIEGKTIRVLVLQEDPKDPKDEFDKESRQYPREDGEIVWCVPWQNCLEKFNWNSWPDADIQGEPVEEYDESEDVILSIKAIIKGSEVVGARGKTEKGISQYQFEAAVFWSKLIQGRRWNKSEQCWDFPFNQDFIKKAAKQIGRPYKYRLGEGIIKFSPRLIEEIKKQVETKNEK
jgi:hypothetical protein